MPEECTIIQSREGYLIDSCTGEVLDFVAYDNVDYSNLEYYERVSYQKRETEKEIKDMKKIVLNYLQSVMTEEEKEMFYKILQKIDEKKLDASFYLAIYEYILEREGKVVTRDYIKFLKMKGLGRHAIRQKKKLLRHVVREDPIIHYIYEYSGDKEEALRIYELLKKKGIMYGKAETRKKILLKYLSDQKLKEKLFEEERMKEIERTLLLLNIRDFDSFSFF